MDRWRYAAARWMTGTAGCSTRWIFTPLGTNARLAELQRSRDVIAIRMSRRACFPLRGWTATTAESSSTIIWSNICTGGKSPWPSPARDRIAENDQAHIEQKNYTQVRLWFGYERYDNPAVVPPMVAVPVIQVTVPSATGPPA